MSETTQFTMGSEVLCSDGACGEVTRVVIDPVARALTHLVVGAGDREGKGRLVPIDLVDSAAGEIRLRCSLSEFAALEEAEETQFLPGAPGQWGYGQDEMLSSPHFALGDGMGGMGMIRSGVGGVGNMGGTGGSEGRETSYDRVPVGEVEVRRGEQVEATDGAIGHVQGLVIDPVDHHVTHVLLEEGHLWGRKEVAIPISAVTDVKDGVWLNLSKHQVRDLPEVGIDRPA